MSNLEEQRVAPRTNLFPPRPCDEMDEMYDIMDKTDCCNDISEALSSPLSPFDDIDSDELEEELEKLEEEISLEDVSLAILPDSLRSLNIKLPKFTPAISLSEEEELAELERAMR